MQVQQWNANKDLPYSLDVATNALDILFLYITVS